MIYASAVRRIIQESAGIEYIGGKVVTSPSSFDTAGLTGGIGTQAEAGDFILIYRSAPSTMAATSDFTQVTSRQHTATTYKTYLSVDKRVAAAAGESLSVSASHLVMMVFRGVSDVEKSVVSSGTNGTLTPPAITPVAPGAVIVAGGASNNGAIVNSPPAGALYSVVNASSNNMDIGMCVGTTKAWAITGSQSGSSKCMASVVLAPV